VVPEVLAYGALGAGLLVLASQVSSAVVRHWQDAVWVAAFGFGPDLHRKRKALAWSPADNRVHSSVCGMVLQSIEAHGVLGSAVPAGISFELHEGTMQHCMMALDGLEGLWVVLDLVGPAVCQGGLAV
jgi:hypothetical protein